MRSNYMTDLRVSSRLSCSSTSFMAMVGSSKLFVGIDRMPQER